MAGPSRSRSQSAEAQLRAVEGFIKPFAPCFTAALDHFQASYINVPFGCRSPLLSNIRAIARYSEDDQIAFMAVCFINDRGCQKDRAGLVPPSLGSISSRDNVKHSGSALVSHSICQKAIKKKAGKKRIFNLSFSVLNSVPLFFILYISVLSND